jgi:hypothetical protein
MAPKPVGDVLSCVEHADEPQPDTGGNDAQADIQQELQRGVERE